MIRNVVFSLSLVLLVAGCKTTNNPAAIPAGEMVSAPAANVSADYAKFSGTWAGSWGNGTLDGKLMVQSIDPQGKIEAIYAWGDSQQWNITAGSSKSSGFIVGNTLTLAPFRNGARVHYEMQADNSLKGFYERNGRTTLGQFKKQ